MSIFKDKVILITGGTGSFGRNFAKFLLKDKEIKKVIIFSRDEFKQHIMSQEISDPRIRFMLGDVRDLSRLQRAFKSVDIVIHAAALKQVPAIEYNPYEAVKTNVLGSQNVIEAAIDNKVPKVLLVSSDKAVQPINLYGATKLCAEKLFVSGNFYSNDTSFSAVRYGNVVGSRGSIVETLMKNKGIKKVQITDPEMTRFWLMLEQSFELVTFALQNMEGGEIFIPKVPSMKLVDLFDTIVPKARKEIVGIRPGEKIHETLLTQDEAKHSVELDKYFVILPEIVAKDNMYKKYSAGNNKISKDFVFSSNLNTAWLTKADFRQKLKKVTLL